MKIIVNQKVLSVEDFIEETLIDMAIQNEDITILELSKRCNLNRNTFYIHYKSIDDAFYAIQERIIHKVLNKINELPIESMSKDPELLAHAVVEALFHDKKLLDFAFKSKRTEEFCILLTKEIVDDLQTRFIQYQPKNEYAYFSIEFLTAGFIYSLRSWYISEKKFDANALIARLGEISRFGVSAYIKK